MIPILSVIGRHSPYRTAYPQIADSKVRFPKNPCDFVLLRYFCDFCTSMTLSDDMDLIRRGSIEYGGGMPSVSECVRQFLADN